MMADAINDETDEFETAPIHYSEAFRRAKRNALFWSVATFMLAWIRIDRDPAAQSDTPVRQSLELGQFGTGASFDLWFLTLVALGILSFMAIGFHRASHDLKRRNANGPVDARAREESVSDLDEQVDDVVEAVLAKAKITTIELDRTRAAIDQQVAQIRQQIEALPANVTWPSMHRSSPPWIGAYAGSSETGTVTIEQVEEIRAEVEASFVEAQKRNHELLIGHIGHIDQLNQTVDPNAPATALEVNGIRSALADAEKEMREMRAFGDRLKTSDVRFHSWYHIRATWGAIGTAVLLGIWRLGGGALDSLLTPGEWLLQLTT